MEGNATIGEQPSEEEIVNGILARRPTTPVLGSRRRVTLSRRICDALGVEPGDVLIVKVEDGSLVITSASRSALEALQTLRGGLHASGVTLPELLKSGRKIRDELFREKYGHLLDKKRT